jgi:hypothetical protein
MSTSSKSNQLASLLVVLKYRRCRERLGHPYNVCYTYFGITHPLPAAHYCISQTPSPLTSGPAYHLLTTVECTITLRIECLRMSGRQFFSVFMFANAGRP